MLLQFDHSGEEDSLIKILIVNSRQKPISITAQKIILYYNISDSEQGKRSKTDFILIADDVTLEKKDDTTTFSVGYSSCYAGSIDEQTVGSLIKMIKRAEERRGYHRVSPATMKQRIPNTTAKGTRLVIERIL